jgi:membrane-associated protease RseP (regulator of RpoE activity)
MVHFQDKYYRRPAMQIRSSILTLLLSFTTIFATLPAAVHSETPETATRGRRGQDISQQNATDEAMRARRDRIRAMGAEAARPEPQKGALGVHVKTLSGVQVLNVLPGSPAEKAGILPDDIIMSVNSIQINSAGQLQQMIARTPASAPISISLVRGGKPLTVSATLGTAVGRNMNSAPKPAVADDIDPTQTSDDPTFGVTKENPVKLGGATLQEGIAASYVYLKQLRDKNRRPFKYSRVGSVGAGADGHITDFYKLTDSNGTEFSLYIDAYHPEINALDSKAPKGMYIAQ